MRTAALLWLAPAALASAIPSFEEAAPAVSFDKRQNVLPNVLGGKILQADLYAGLAAINQQIYQATQKSDQFKKCNPTNIIVRKEWYVYGN
jgi:tyrosinase